MWRKKPEEVSPEIEEGKKYNNSDLSAIADAILREDARSEVCRECEAQGEKTGVTHSQPQYDEKGKPLTDKAGNELALEFPEIKCPNGHAWFQGEGRAKGIGGEDPILFEEHFQSRRRREIYTTVGTPDPSIVAGIYNRSHPQGRKINSPEQRSKNGASWYR